MTKNEDETVFFHGFDYLRILFTLFVVAWHMKLLGKDNLFSTMRDTYFMPSISDIVYCNVFLVAVPLFFLVSMFLYIFNRKSKRNYFVKRSKQVLFLYLIWTLAASTINQHEITLHKLTSFRYMISGAGSTTYFLIEIVIMTAIIEMMLQLKPKIKSSNFNILTIFLFGASCVLLAVMQFISVLFDSRAYLFLSYYSPLNFFPYPFLAIILYELYSKNKNILNRWHLLLLFLAMIFLIIVEWKTLPSNSLFAENSFLLPPYSRLSLVIASVLLLVFFIKFSVDGGKTIKTLSELTLGVFLIHMYILNYYSTVTPELATFTSNNMPLYYAVIVVMSFGVTYCIKKTKIV